MGVGTRRRHLEISAAKKTFTRARLIFFNFFQLGLLGDPWFLERSGVLGEFDSLDMPFWNEKNRKCQQPLSAKNSRHFIEFAYSPELR